MSDSLYTLKKWLQPVFHLEAKRNGSFVYSEIQYLQEAIDTYDPKDSSTFIHLLEAIRASLPYIEKWHVPFDAIKDCVDALNQAHGMLSVDWGEFLLHPRVSTQFQISALHDARQDDLLMWIGFRVGRPCHQIGSSELAQALIEHSDAPGFNRKLDDYLKKDPQFLFNIIATSRDSFIKIVSSRLIFYLTDQQIARAIVHYLPCFIENVQNPFDQVECLIAWVNKALSNGRSVSTLLHNTEAKLILESSVIFQIYQSESYKVWEAAKHQLPLQERRASLK